MQITVNCEIQNRIERWNAQIKNLSITPSNCEFEVQALGDAFHVIMGAHLYGRYVCIPNWEIGCELATFNDTFWNSEQLVKYLGIKNTATVVSAIKEIGELSQIIQS